MTNDLSDDDRHAVRFRVDGELTAADAAAFDARVAREPALAAALARERALRARLQSAYAPVLEEAVPAALLDMLAMPGEAQDLPPRNSRPDTDPAPAMAGGSPGRTPSNSRPDTDAVLAMAGQRQDLTPQNARPDPDRAANEPLPAALNDSARGRLPNASRWQWPQWGAIAAALVLGLALGGRVWAPHPAAGNTDTPALAVAGDGAVTAQGALRDALDQRVAGTDLDPNSRIGVGLTFRDHAKQYCRTFTLDSSSSGIACRQKDGWVLAQLEHARNARAGEAGAYRTAASPLSPALLQAIDAMRDGDTLDAAAEAAARANGWKP